MQSVLPEDREDRRYNEDQGNRRKRGKGEETMMFENKKDNALMYVLQNTPIYSYIQENTDEDHKMIAYLKFI